jgi:hypothetical protein
VAVKPEQELSVTKRERQRDEYAAESHTLHDAASGDTFLPEPAAWAVYEGDELVRLFYPLTPAETLASAHGLGLVALYRAPPAGSVRLTDEDRRELEAAASDYESGAEKIVYGHHAYRRRAATLRGLLARATKEGGR